VVPSSVFKVPSWKPELQKAPALRFRWSGGDQSSSWSISSNTAAASGPNSRRMRQDAHRFG
jgi:hypothetical protein